MIYGLFFSTFFKPLSRHLQKVKFIYFCHNGIINVIIFYAHINDTGIKYPCGFIELRGNLTGIISTSFRIFLKSHQNAAVFCCYNFCHFSHFSLSTSLEHEVLM